MATVPSSTVEMVSSSTKTGKPVAFLAVGNPLVAQVNYILGYLLGGIRVFQSGSGTTLSEDRTYSFYTYRHPNCDHVDVWFGINMATPNAPCSIAVTAGAGTTKTITENFIRPSGSGSVLYTIRAPWAAGDSGYKIITVTCTNVALSKLVILDCPRKILESGDSKLEFFSSSSLRCRIQEAGAIAASADGSLYSASSLISTAWDNYKRQAFAWSAGSTGATTGDAYTIASGGGFVNVFDTTTPMTITHRGRMKKSTDTTRSYRCYFRAFTPGGSYVCRVAVTNGVTTTNYDSASFSNLTFSWQAPITSIAVDCTADALISFQISATSKNAICSDISMVEE